MVTECGDEGERAERGAERESKSVEVRKRGGRGRFNREGSWRGEAAGGSRDGERPCEERRGILEMQTAKKRGGREETAKSKPSNGIPGTSWTDQVEGCS